MKIKSRFFKKKFYMTQICRNFFMLINDEIKRHFFWGGHYENIY